MTTTLVYGGIPIRIDRPVGYVQRGVASDGTAWERTYDVPYGEIAGTNGGDGDALDVYCGPNPDAPMAFWGEQKKHDGSFDEYKIGLGFDNEADFVACYCRHTPAVLLGRVRPMPVAQMRALLGLDPITRAATLAHFVELDLGPGDVHVTGPVRVVGTKPNRPIGSSDEGEALGAWPLPKGSTHPAVTAPHLTGFYSGPPYQDGWVGWCEDAKKTWIFFLNQDGKAFLWVSRDPNGGIVGDPFVFDRSDLLPAAARNRAMTDTELRTILARAKGPITGGTAHAIRMGYLTVNTAGKVVLAGGERALDDLNAKKRNALPDSAFALPKKRGYPIHDAAHVRAAASRLEQAKKAGTVTPGEYAEAKRAIAKAARRFGIASQYNKPGEKKAADVAVPIYTPRFAGKRGRLHVHVGLGPNGQHHVEFLHASDPDGTVVRCDGLEITADCAAPAVDPSADVAALRTLAETTRADGKTAEADALDEQAKRLLADAKPKPVWIQLAKVGAFRGHPAGPFELTPAIFAEIVQNFTATENRRIPIDFEHASEQEATSGTIPVDGAPAQGWIIDLDNRGATGLWGLVEWLEPARTYIREGKYRYFSPAIRFGARDRVTGKPIGARMTSGALTNTPFLDGMKPLAARDQTPSNAGAPTTMTHPVHEKMKQLKGCMKLSDLATYADMKDHLAKLREHATAAGVMDKPHAHAMGAYNMGVHLGDYIPQMADCISAGDHMSIADILSAVESMIDAAIAEHVEEYHMADIDPTQALVKLGEANEKIARLMSEKTTLASEKSRVESANAQTTLQLRDATSRAERAEAKVTELEGTIATMRDQETQRVEGEIVQRVERAYVTYKDTKKLSDHDKAAMLITAKANPDLFGKLYPEVQHPHLLANLSGTRTPGPGTAPHQMGDRQGPMPLSAPGQVGLVQMNAREQSELASRLMRERQMTVEEANRVALKVAKGLVKNPFLS